MELYIQFGYGMMSMSEELIKKWEGGTIILSPRDLSLDQIERFSNKISNLKGNIVVDPQFYIPRSEHDRLSSHEFWPTDYQTNLFDENAIGTMLNTLNEKYNVNLNSSFFIIPSIFCSEINEDWNNMQKIYIKETNKLNIDKPKYATICLSQSVLKSEHEIHNALEFIEDWDVEGIYLVPEPPNNDYLTNDPIWLLNLLDLTSGIKLQKKKLVVGYANHQLLCLALTKTDAIASGNWLNVRSFDLNKFNKPPDDGASRRSTWYYCPQALSEYQIPMLDISNRLGILGHLKTDAIFKSEYAAPLFSGAQPSSTNYGERDSFQHYLQSLRMQVLNTVKKSYEQTRKSINIQLETASRHTDFLYNSGIRGKGRDFSNVVEETQSAVIAFNKLKGMRLNHNWDSL